MQLTEKHYRCIEYILKGYQFTDIAKKVPCCRQTIYTWLNDKEFKAELDRCRLEIKKQAENKVLDEVSTYIDKIKDLAFSSDSDNVKLNALELLLERSLGKVTTKVEQTVKEDNKEDAITDLDSMLEDIQKEVESDNVIDLEEKKKAK